MRSQKPGGIIVAVVTAALAISMFACSSHSRASSEKTEPPPTHEATPTARVLHSGVPSVDAVIDAVASGDATALAQLFRFPKIGCTAAHEGLGGPPDCPDGFVDGTPIEAMPVLYCEGTYLVPGQEEQASARFVGADPAIYGVYQPVPAPDLPETEYAVLFSVARSGLSDLGYQLFVANDGHVVGLSFGCDQGPGWIVQYWHYGNPLPLG